MVRAAIIADEERRAGKQCRQLRQFTGAHERSYRGGVGDLIDNALGDFDFIRAADQDDFDVVIGDQKVNQLGEVIQRPLPDRRTHSRLDADETRARFGRIGRCREQSGIRLGCRDNRLDQPQQIVADMRALARDSRIAFPGDHDIKPGKLVLVIEPGEPSRAGAPQQEAAVGGFAEIDREIEAVRLEPFAQFRIRLLRQVAPPQFGACEEQLEIDEFIDLRDQFGERPVCRATSADRRAWGNASRNRRSAGKAVTKSPIWSSLTTRMLADVVASQ